MRRRMIALLVAVTSLAALAAPASAAEVYRVRATGVAILATFTNLPEKEEWETLPPGDYFYTQVFGARQLAVGDATYEDNYACVFSGAFSIDENGGWSDKAGVYACGEAQTLTVDRRLTTGRLVATLEVNDCAAWDEVTGECLEPITGTIEVDLTLEGFGRVSRNHGTSTGGTAGISNNVYHDVGAERAATPSGTVEFDGESLIDGATNVSGDLFDASGGWLEVVIGG